MSSLYILCEEVGEEAFGLWLQPAAKLWDSWFLFTVSYFGYSMLHSAKKGGQNLLSSTPQNCVDFICVYLTGGAEFSSALEILFLSKKVNRRWYLHTLKKSIELLLNVPLMLIFFSEDSIRWQCEVELHIRPSKLACLLLFLGCSVFLLLIPKNCRGTFSCLKGQTFTLCTTNLVLKHYTVFLRYTPSHNCSGSQDPGLLFPPFWNETAFDSPGISHVAFYVLASFLLTGFWPELS